jgi:malate synthase
VGILYIESWLRGHGAVALYNLMEDAATVRFQERRFGNGCETKSKMMEEHLLHLYKELLAEEVAKIKIQIDEKIIKVTIQLATSLLMNW